MSNQCDLPCPVQIELLALREEVSVQHATVNQTFAMMAEDRLELAETLKQINLTLKQLTEVFLAGKAISIFTKWLLSGGATVFGLWLAYKGIK